MSAVGTVVAGRFRLERPLGHGGMGEVWVAFDDRLAARCAIKFLQATSEPEAQARFHREAQTAAQLRSPYVVAMLDHGMSDGRAYIAMELLEGEDLSKRLRRVGALDPGETVRIITHIGRALSRAHALGLIHRDLKPANVVVVRDEDGPIAKVLDFGIAKVTSDVRIDSARLDAGPAADVSFEQTIEGHTLGTPTHMSPEHVNGLPVDHRSDLWALGVVAYECVTGMLPFRARNLGELVQEITSKPFTAPSALSPSLPPALDSWFERALAKSRDQRFADAKEMTEAFASALGVSVQPHAAPSTIPRTLEAPPPESLPFARTEALDTHARRSTSRSRSWVIAVPVLVLAVGAAAAALYWSRPERADRRAAADEAEDDGDASPPRSASSAPSLPPYASMKVVQIAGGILRTCVRFEDGRVACWGTNPRVDTKDWGTSTTAVPAFERLAVTELHGAFGAMCAFSKTEPARCFDGAAHVAGFIENQKPSRIGITGTGICGLVGTDLLCAGLLSEAPNEVAVQAKDVRTFVVGASSGCVITNQSKVQCWMPPSGLVDLTTHLRSLSPREIPSLAGSTQLSAGVNHACFVRADAKVACVGDPLFGVLGFPDERKVVQLAAGMTQLEAPDMFLARVVPNLHDVVRVVSGNRFNCALTKDRKVLCWGANDLGQLGRGATSNSEPTPALALDDVAVLGAGGEYACATKTSGEMFCWGSAQGDQLARTPSGPCGATTCQPTPSPAKPW